MGRYEELQKRHERMSAKLGIDAAEDNIAAEGRVGGRGIKLVLVAVALLMVIAGAVLLLGPMQRGDPDKKLAAVAERYGQAVGLVIVSTEDGDIPFATAWAVKPNLFVSNAHVTKGAQEYMERGMPVFIALNGKPGVHFRVTAVYTHPDYLPETRQETESVCFAYDVGCFTIAGETDVCFEVAPDSELSKLKAGYRVAYLGFPMERLVKGGVDIRSPVANMQSGIITAVSDFMQGDSGFRRNYLIRHNMGTTGGSSGSPLFNEKAQVVAVLNAANMALQVVGEDKNGKAVLARTPSAAMINFAQRVDLVSDVPLDRPQFVVREAPASGEAQDNFCKVSTETNSVEK